jgi:hypothetical protein
MDAGRRAVLWPARLSNTVGEGIAMTSIEDIELLKRAAAIAGVEYDKTKVAPHPKSGAFWGLWLVIKDEPSEYDRRYWNPLTDDGDALRLASKLRIGIEWWDSMPNGIAGRINFDGNGVILMDATQERMTVLRRAIVRAAASFQTTTSEGGTRD